MNDIARTNDSALRSIAVAGAVAFVCALLVSVVAVNLRPYQDANRAAERAERVSAIIRTIPGLGHLADAGAADVLVIELGSRHFAPDGVVTDLDQQLKDEALSLALPAAQDPAGLKRLEKYQSVFAIKDEAGAYKALILPIRGLGYASTLYGYLAVAGDGRTILGIEFYQHGETPGLGARIEDPAWKSQWAGKRAYDDGGRAVIKVVKGQAADDTEVDAISGATRTSDGVDAMVRFWLGPMGYGPFLESLREDG